MHVGFSSGIAQLAVFHRECLTSYHAHIRDEHYLKRLGKDLNKPKSRLPYLSNGGILPKDKLQMRKLIAIKPKKVKGLEKQLERLLSVPKSKEYHLG